MDGEKNPRTRVWVEELGLEVHPEGGWYRRTHESQVRLADGRATASAIEYVLGPGERSHWHRVDADELWHHYAGPALELRISRDGVTIATIALGPDILAGERPQATVPTGAWQSATNLHPTEPVLVGCTVSPAFLFEGFVLAPEGWEPGAADPRVS
jgi:predicted cupin superfamily sugar epimerase